MRASKIKKTILCILVFLTTAAGQILGRILNGMMDGTADYGSTALTETVENGFLWGAGAVILCLAGYYFAKEEFFTGTDGRMFTRIHFLFIYGGILLCWLPCYIAYYPANYSYDGEPQLIQYTTGAFDSHHPILHTLLLGWSYSLGQILRAHGIPVDGMAIYSAGQALILAFAFAKIIRFAARRGASKLALILFTIYFAFFPLHPLMAVTTTKDTLFTAFFVLFLLRLADRMSLTDSSRKEIMRNDLALLTDAVLMMLFRKNGVYLVGLLTVTVLFAALFKEIGRKKYFSSVFMRMGVVLILCIVLFTAADRGLVTMTGAIEGEAGEALSVPLQQIARTYKSNGDRLTEQELKEITTYISEDGMDQYRPFVSDGVKQNFNNEAYRADPAGFFRIWLQLAKEYPGSYGMAFLYQTMGAWYPEDVSHTEVYKNWWRDRVCYFVTDAEPVFSGYDFVEQDNLLPGVRSFYESIVTDLSYRNFIGTMVLFSPCFWCFGAVLLPLSLLFARRRRAFLVSLPVLGQWIMILLGPCVISRYFYPFMALLPILFILLLGNDDIDPGAGKEFIKELQSEKA